MGNGTKSNPTRVDTGDSSDHYSANTSFSWRRDDYPSGTFTGSYGNDSTISRQEDSSYSYNRTLTFAGDGGQTTGAGTRGGWATGTESLLSTFTVRDAANNVVSTFDNASQIGNYTYTLQGTQTYSNGGMTDSSQGVNCNTPHFLGALLRNGSSRKERELYGTQET